MWMTTCPSSTCERAIPPASPRLLRGSKQACGPLTSTIWGGTRALYAVHTLPSFPARPRETWRRFRDELFRQSFTLNGMLPEGFALLGDGPAKNSCSAQWVAFGWPVENCAQPAQFNSVHPPLREPRRQHGTSKWVYGRTAPRSLGPKLQYCARMSRQGDAFARIGC